MGTDHEPCGLLREFAGTVASRLEQMCIANTYPLIIHRHNIIRAICIFIFNSTPIKMSDDGKVLHSAVAKTANGYVLPPLTLLEVVDEQDSFEYLPGKVINQKLIVVRPTFLLPMKRSSEEVAGSSKFAGDRAFLHYGGTGDAVRGLAEITDEPPLTMRQEVGALRRAQSALF